MDKTPGQMDSESMYWEFDARKKGYGKWKGIPQSERDAFKAVIAHVCQHIEAEASAKARAAAFEDGADEMQRRSDRDKMRANEQTGVVGFGVTAAFAACYHDAAVALRALVAAPVGHVCVPVEPTASMIIAGIEDSLLRKPSPDDGNYVYSIYTTMLAAARPK